jgi:tetratricopeptide (TPR) repeat protein
LLRQKKPSLNTEHIESIAELSGIYLQSEAAEFSEDDLVSSLRALYELSQRQDVKMSKAHARKIQKMVIGAQGVFGNRLPLRSSEGAGEGGGLPAHKKHLPKSEHIATEDGLSGLMKNAKIQADALRYFDSALKSAERTSDDLSRSEAFSSVGVAMAQAGKDPSAAFDSALKAAERIIDDTFRPIAFQNIAGAMAQAGKFDSAILTTDNSVNDHYHRTKAFCSIAAAMAQAGKNPLVAFDFALKAAERLDSTSSRDDALDHIITTMAQAGSIDSALKIAERITDKGYISHSYSTIAAAMAQAGNFDAALKTAELISDDLYRSELFCSIAVAKAQAGKDPTAQLNLAIKAAERISEEFERACAFGYIAAAMTRTNRFDSANEVLERIKTEIKEDERAQAFDIIAVAMAEVGKFDSALKTAESIPSKGYCFAVFTKIVAAMAQAGKFGLALDTAESITGDHRPKAFCTAAVAMAQAGNFGLALDTAERITDNKSRANAFSSIAAAMAKSTPQLHEKDCEAVLGHALQTHNTRLLREISVLMPFEKLLKLEGRATSEAIDAKASLYSFFSASEEQQKLLFKTYQKELLSSPQGSHNIKLASRILANLEGIVKDGSSLSLLMDTARESHDVRILHTLSEMESFRAKDLVLRTACTGELDDRISWLLINKLVQTGYLDPNLRDFYKQELQEGVDKNFLLKTTQKTVSQINLTPNAELLQYFISKAKNERQLDLAIAKVGDCRAEFDKVTDKDKLASILANDPEKSLLFYILNAGRTHYSLVNNYDSRKMATVLKATEGLKVHEPTLEQALTVFPEEMREGLRERLLAGSFPLGGSYSRDVRVDVSSSAQLETVESRAAAVFGKEEIGVLLKVGFYMGQLRGTKEEAVLASCNGLADAAAAIAEIEKGHPELIPALEQRFGKVWKKLGEKEVLSLSFHAVLDSNENKIDIKKTIKGIEVQRRALENAIRQRYKSGAIDKMLRDEQIGLLEEKAKPKLMRYLIEEFASTKTKAEERIFSEWESHLTDVFESFEKVAATEQPISKNKTVTLSYLDKRTDIIECLRFADAAQCCFTSTQYTIEGQTMGNAQWIARIWKDPLFFVYGIFDQYSHDAKQRNAVGFVFGSISAVDGEPALLLNGIYMDSKTPQAAQSILSTIEQDFARPLGCKEMFVAARHGGATTLGADYANDEAPFIRLRAIDGGDGRPETKIHDDLITDKEGSVNKPQLTDGKIWHKNL